MSHGQSDLFEFRLSDTHYLHINCLPCKREAIVEYVGLDPTMPQIKVTCPQCKEDRTVKINNPLRSGFHRDPDN